MEGKKNKQKAIEHLTQKGNRWRGKWIASERGRKGKEKERYGNRYSKYSKYYV